MSNHALITLVNIKTAPYRGFILVNETRRRDGWRVAHRGRIRWGTLAEVKADVDHVLIHGKLPDKKEGWA